jgi:hypothetical protein
LSFAACQRPAYPCFFLMSLKETTMRQVAMRQRELFEEPEGLPPAALPQQVQQTARQLLVLWMQSLAKAISEEAVNEQDPR